MAMFDDTQWLLSHIQNSYATSDDSGLSEVVLQANWPVDKLVDFPFLHPDDSILAEDYNEPPPHSPDVHTDQCYLGHRFRSDTQHRLDKMKKDKNVQAKITRITWQPTTAELSESEAEELFGARPVPPAPAPQQEESLLAQLLEEADCAQNPYLEYAKWDASTDVSVATKRLTIFVYSAGGTEAPQFPVRVVVNPAAKVLDVIGLTCFLYTRDGLSPALLGPASSYSLRIADEDGSVDWDFMPLIHGNTFDKFGFRVLAIAWEQQPSTELCQDLPVTVTVHISGGVFSLIECESRSVLLREVLQRTIAKRREMIRVVEAGVQYHLERSCDEPGRHLDLDRTLADVDTVILHAVRDNSRRAPCPDTDEVDASAGLVSQTFAVTWVKKWAKFDAAIDVSSGGVFVSVTGGGTGGLLRPPHPVSYPSNKIVCCNIKSANALVLGKKLAGNKEKAGATEGGKVTKKGFSEGNKATERGSGGRCEVLLTCQGEQRFKDYQLECDQTTGMELVEAVKKIKTEDTSNKNTRDEEKPKRRYSLAGLKKRNRTSLGQRGHPN